jgi:hypothetical protein
MIALNAKTGKKYCDLFCYMCEGYSMTECLLASSGLNMRLLMAICLGNHVLFSTNKPRVGYWCEHIVLTPEIVDNQKFPDYLLKKRTGNVPEQCH